MMSIEERYNRDPMIHALVESLVTYIQKLELTPTEIRECAVLAAIKAQQRCLPKYFYNQKCNRGYQDEDCTLCPDRDTCTKRFGESL